jgi:hypothetical protein
MSEQRGLRNPDTHGTTSDGEPYCESCGVCDEGWRCRCCLAAEVEALRGENKALKYMVERDTAAIQRVRELHGRHDPNCPYGEDCAGAGLCLACREEYPCATIRALDGLEGRIDD